MFPEIFRRLAGGYAFRCNSSPRWRQLCSIERTPDAQPRPIRITTAIASYFPSPMGATSPDGTRAHRPRCTLPGAGFPDRVERTQVLRRRRPRRACGTWSPSWVARVEPITLLGRRGDQEIALSGTRQVSPAGMQREGVIPDGMLITGLQHRPPDAERLNSGFLHCRPGQGALRVEDQPSRKSWGGAAPDQPARHAL